MFFQEIKRYEKPYYERVEKNKLLINNVDWNKYDIKAEVTKMGNTLEVEAVLQYEGDIPEDLLLFVSLNGVHAVVNRDKNRICGVLEMRQCAPTPWHGYHGITQRLRHSMPHRRRPQRGHHPTSPRELFSLTDSLCTRLL
jgi:hypothetical protein